MRVFDANGSSKVDSDQELTEILSRRTKDGWNEFWLHPDTEEWPALTLMVVGEKCVVHYFPAGEGTVLRSTGGSEAQGSTTFRGGIPAQDVLAPNRAVVTLESAVRAALAFRSDQGPPGCLEWEEMEGPLRG